jgi:hypothetical protein
MKWKVDRSNDTKKIKGTFGKAILKRLMVLSSVFLSLGPSPGFAGGNGVVSGYVVDSANQPVRKAIVTLTWHGTPRSWATTRSDETGQFRFEGLPSGSYDLRASKVGEGHGAFGANTPRELGKVLALADGELRSGILIRFLRGATLSGSVFDSNNNPMPHLHVLLLKRGKDSLSPVGQGATDDRGAYRFDDIPAGQYYALATPTSKPEGTDGYFARFFPNSRDSKGATLITLGDDQHMYGIDFHLERAAASKIEGRIVERVTGPTAAPKVLSIVVSPADDYIENCWSMEVRLDRAKTAFNVTLKAGRYYIDAIAPSEGMLLSASQVVEVPNTSDEVVLELAPALNIKGKLVVEQSSASPPMFLEIQLLESRCRKRLVAYVASDGSFTFSQVPSGTWKLSVSGMPPSAFVKKALFRIVGDDTHSPGLDARFDRVQIVQNSEYALEITVSTNTARVRGSVSLEGRDQARAGILMVSKPESELLYYDGISDYTGQFEIRGVRPGNYKVFALENLDVNDFKNPRAIESLTPLGADVSVLENGDIEVHPRLISTTVASEVLR